MTIIITGPVPSKKNSKTLLIRNGRPLILPGKVHQKWHRQALPQLYGVPRVREVSEISLEFWATDRRRADLSNRAESVMDLLVDGGVLEDDNWWVVKKLNLSFGGVDKANPRVVVEIK